MKKFIDKYNGQLMTLSVLLACLAFSINLMSWTNSLTNYLCLFVSVVHLLVMVFLV